jgi:hypothetical protein
MSHFKILSSTSGSDGEKYAFAHLPYSVQEMGASCGKVKRKVHSVRVKWQVDTDTRERGCNVALMNATGRYILPQLIFLENKKQPVVHVKCTC